MAQDHSETERLLREAAKRADDAERSAQRRRAEQPVGTANWWGGAPRWGDTRLLDVVEEEFGVVARWTLVVVRELVLAAVLFWAVAFVLGLAVEPTEDVMGLTVVQAAVALTFVLRLLVGAVVAVVARVRRRRRTAAT